MGNSSLVLEKWRNYFSSANGDLFEVIEKAILIASCDCPDEFKMKRDQIAEMLFTCKVAKCDGCDKIELVVPNIDGSKDSKESKDVDDDDGEFIEIEIDPQFLKEVLKIKEITDNSEDKSDELVFDSLRQLQQKLQQMPLTFVILKETQIGKSVNALQKHPEKEIRKLARTLIQEWKIMVNAWLDAAKADGGAEVRPESIKESVAEEKKGLPSPTLNEGSFCAAPTSIELSQFESPNKDSMTSSKDFKAERKRNQASIMKKQTPPNAELGANRQNVTNEIKVQQKSGKGTISKKPIPHQQQKFNCDDKPSLRVKLEIAKRKLHERYQETDDAKKRRTTQFLEFHDLPKQRNQHMGPGNNHRQ